MAIQFAGSSSTGDRRRRRLVVNGDGAGVDSSLHEGDGAEIESQLVASAAAGPWVPVTEMRIWIYATLIGVLLGTLTSALACPGMIHTNLIPLTDHLLAGPRPVLVVYLEVALLAMSAQMGILIGWYRSRCRLDFGGRHRVWPWAAGLFAIAAFYLATDAHRTFGQLIGVEKWLSWRGHTVTWLLPICVAALPISLFLDRDVRNNRSSLWTLRLSGVLWLTEALFEIYQPELQSQSWFQFAFLVIPLYASATLFVGLWLHARIVAYVCPDPPELDEQSALSQVVAACRWIGRSLMFWRRRGATAEEEEGDSKPKRRRKKAEGEAEATTKRKRKTPAKRTTSRTRTRTKPVEEEAEEESSDETNTEESDSGNESQPSVTDSKSSWNDNQEQWQEEPDEPEPAKPSVAESKGNGRFTQVHKSHGTSTPAPHARKQAQSWEEESNAEEEARTQSSDSSDDDDDEGQNDSGSGEQMKGLSKRQKRELRKQQRDQERARGR